MKVMISLSHTVTAAPSSSGGGLLILFPCFSVGSLPRDTILHELLQHVPSIGLSPSGTGCFSMGVTSPTHEPTPAWASPGVTTPFRHPPAQYPPSWWISASLWSPCAQGLSCLTLGCPMGCRGISAPAPGAPPAPPALTWVSAGLFLSYILTPLFGYSCPGFSLPPKSVISGAVALSLMGSASASIGSVWSWLALDLLDMREVPGSYSQKPPL